MTTTSTIKPRLEAPPEVQILAEALSARHGDVSVRFESSGLHLYMAAPCELESDGRIELEKCHLAVNADRFLRRGRFAAMPRTVNEDRSAQCMKCGKGYLVSRLLAWPKLDDRGIKDTTHKVKVSSATACLVDDGRGNKIPPPPGRCRLITELPHDHVAVQYLVGRQYDLPTLVRQFRCSYCEEELPEDHELGIGYRRLAAGFNDTPQGRIIFFGDIDGVQKRTRCGCSQVPTLAAKPVTA